MRPIAETGWTLEAAARSYVRKIALARKADGATFRTMEWRLYCENKDRARLMFAREFDNGAAGMNSVVMMAGSEKPVAFGKFPARIGTYEAWSGTIASDAMKTVLAASHLQMGEATSMPDGKTSQATFDIDTMGLGPAWTQLVATCPVAPSPAVFGHDKGGDCGPPLPGFLTSDEAAASPGAALCRLGHARCFFAERAGVPCAIGVSLRAGDAAFVDGAATLPEHRGHGCQSALEPADGDVVTVVDHRRPDRGNIASPCGRAMWAQESPSVLSGGHSVLPVRTR